MAYPAGTNPLVGRPAGRLTALVAAQGLARVKAALAARGLSEEDLTAEPTDLFAQWFALAVESGVDEPAAMTLATVGLDGGVDARLVLLRGHDERGFVWFTNRDSAKGRQLAAHPTAAIIVAWTELGRQVRATGPVEPTTADEDEAYWATRPRGSRLAATASDQSRPLADRAALEAAVAALDAAHAGEPIPRPGNWGGYRLRPERMEFWQQQEFRLHDRFRYERTAAGWLVTRLAP
jgi:pyridoxamine 5'-phosphate oxidase